MPAVVAASETVVYRFHAGADAQTPQVPLVADSTGTLYGSAYAGGSNGLGAVFSLVPPAAGTPVQDVVLHSFGGSADDGAHPQSAVTFDAAGNLYGTTSGGGANGVGIAFELVRPSAPGGVWEEKILHAFTGDDGASPHGQLVFGKDGALYGTTFFGGPTFSGTVFRLVPQTDGSWTEEVIYAFNGGNDGSEALSTVVFDRAGNLYGTAIGGGTANNGVVFELSPNRAGGAWHQRVLYNFDAPGDGAQPQTGVVFDRQGNLFGTTVVGGTQSYGTVFKLTPPAAAGQPWTEAVLHNFAYNIEGTPGLGLPLLDEQGNLLGTSAGGTAHFGEVWKLTPPVDGGDWTLVDLHDFTAAPDGSGPGGGLLKLKGGRYIGTTEEGGSSRNFGFGTVYVIQP